ncbi:DegT/DnrJ/EryC1/StrS family aminotransferase [Hominiventricola aquisgranensis]|uniref:Aminotransferase class I/II-fold pyridoxal phosphate-dependent enzyme n=1 Tax=Hominiventricola aquisgranensis TaxID=3133164 RepID=A0ABV1I0R1_9FIRM
MAHIYLASPHMSEEGYEQQYVKEAFDTNWIAPLGKNVNEFEKELAAYVGAKDAAALSSGSAALHLALKAAGVKSGDIVFCQDLTFSATANPIAYEKAIPVFIDSDYETWNMSPEALERAFEKYPDVKAVMPVHLYGLPANMDRIMEICKKHGVPVIEDAAESLGTLYHGQYTGTFGDYGAFSFNGNKIITTSGGGMLVCNLPEEQAKERIAKVRFWATQAREKARHYEHKEIGYNYRMSNIVAGIGRGQMKVLDQRIEQKRHIFAYYQEHLGDLEGLSFMPLHENERANCWLSVIQLTPDCKVCPLDVMVALEQGDIESRPVWKPMHMQPVFADCDYIDNGKVGESLFENGVCLPSDTKMTDEDLKRICTIIRGLWK